MGFKQDLVNYPLKVLFSNTLTKGDADEFVQIATNITTLDISPSNVGFLIKNVGTDVTSFFYIKHTNTNHGNNSGFYLGVGESVFVECGSISDIFIKSNTNTSISYQVIGN